MIKAILVDDHELFRLGVKTAIAKNYTDIKIVGEAETGAGFFNLLKTVQADIVLLDIILPDTTGIEIARRLKTEYPELKILAISAENTAEVVNQMLNIGIDGFITKRMGGVTELVEAIRSIMAGFEFFGKDISEIIHRIYLTKKNTVEVTNEFTKQEQRIIELCHEGLLAKEIARQLEISPRTVETHKANIFLKLGINNTAEMVRYALKNGIIRVSD
ncbi:MAG: response regulator transcription factor [Bacteroidetes bacterium]|nr:response regulator transcription factor [Bacteroidota bacterium]MCL2302603.1 response regulator transcription factor [Lentimicrobiaceae bacterium]